MWPTPLRGGALGQWEPFSRRRRRHRRRRRRSSVCFRDTPGGKASFVLGDDKFIGKIPNTKALSFWVLLPIGFLGQTSVAGCEGRDLVRGFLQNHVEVLKEDEIRPSRKGAVAVAGALS